MALMMPFTASSNWSLSFNTDILYEIYQENRIKKSEIRVEGLETGDDTFSLSTEVPIFAPRLSKNLIAAGPE